MAAPNVSSAALALLTLLAAYTTYLVFTPPHRSPPATAHDRVTSTALFKPIFWAMRVLATSLIAYHSFLTLTHAPSNPPSLLCPQPGLLTPSLFTWAPGTVCALAALLAGAAFRTLAYRHLGPSFTFTLHAPPRLVTSGVYRYAQHPSYTGGVVATAGLLALVLRPDGAAACWLPGWAVRRTTMALVARLGALAVMCLAVRARVGDEERMMDAAFGGEWREWSARTARFVPGVF